MTTFTDNAATFATRADQAITWQRHDGIRGALLVLTADKPHRLIRSETALHVLLRSVHRQALLAGVDVAYPMLTRQIPVATRIPCGRCGDQGQVVHPGDTWRPAGDPAVRLVDCPSCDGGAR